MYVVTHGKHLLMSLLGEAVPQKAGGVWWFAGVRTEGSKAPAYH